MDQTINFKAAFRPFSWHRGKISDCQFSESWPRFPVVANSASAYNYMSKLSCARVLNSRSTRLSIEFVFLKFMFFKNSNAARSLRGERQLLRSKWNVIFQLIDSTVTKVDTNNILPKAQHNKTQRFFHPLQEQQSCKSGRAFQIGFWLGLGSGLRLTNFRV